MLTGQIALTVINGNVHFERTYASLPFEDLVHLRFVRVETLTLFGVIRWSRLDELILRQEVFLHALDDYAHLDRNELAFETCGFKNLDGLLIAHRVSQHLFHSLVVGVQRSVTTQRLAQ